MKANAPALNRRSSFPLGTVRELAYLFFAPPASAASLGSGAASGRFTRMQDSILLLLRMTGLRAALVRYHQWRMRVAIALMKRFGIETSMPVWCSSRFRRHQRASIRLGFLIEREFALARRAIRGPELYRAFCALRRARFPDGYWSCAAKGTRINVADSRVGAVCSPV